MSIYQASQQNASRCSNLWRTNAKFGIILVSQKGCKNLNRINSQRLQCKLHFDRENLVRSWNEQLSNTKTRIVLCNNITNPLKYSAVKSWRLTFFLENLLIKKRNEGFMSRIWPAYLQNVEVADNYDDFEAEDDDKALALYQAIQKSACRKWKDMKKSSA